MVRWKCFVAPTRFDRVPDGQWRSVLLRALIEFHQLARPIYWARDVGLGAQTVVSFLRG